MEIRTYGGWQIASSDRMPDGRGWEPIGVTSNPEGHDVIWWRRRLIETTVPGEPTEYITPDELTVYPNAGEDG